ncbi:MAG: helix-turn-helix domain-containing protein [Ignavibacteriales bacterium]|nr:MAG: helix-turn-helix domain-containing protein [Ignavibacteriales bacterium]
MKTVLLTLVIISCNYTLQFAQTLSFKYLTTENGLSNNTVYDLVQDKTGFLWFATEDGLNRYDGYEFKIFRHDPTNKNSISDNSIWSLREDSKGNIWIGTRNGWLNCYDPVKNNFRKWRIRSEQLETNAITFLMEDNQNNIWIGTYRGGLYKFNTITEKIDHWYHKPEDKNSLSNNYVSSILEDKTGNIWISTYNGLNKFNPSRSIDKFEKYFSLPGNSNSISDNIVWYLTQSTLDPGLIWIGTANGLSSYNIYDNKFSRYNIPNKNNLQFGTGAGSVIEEVIDRDTVLWIDSYAGLIKLNITDNKFERFTSEKRLNGNLSSNQLHRILKDNSGTLWAASVNGINYTSQTILKFNVDIHPDGYSVNTSSLKNRNIKAVIKGPENSIWCGTDDGLYYSVIRQDQLEFIKHSQTTGLNIWSLSADTDKNIWIGTYGSGLYKIDLKTNHLTKIPLKDRKSLSLANEFNKAVFTDGDSCIWIGFWGVGLGKYSIKDKSFKRWFKNSYQSNSISYDDVWTIFRDSEGKLWIGTDGGGLNLFDEVNEKFYQFTGEGSIINNNCIYDFIESSFSRKGKQNSRPVLWAGTNNGLYRIELKSSGQFSEMLNDASIRHYTIKDGLADNSVKSIKEDSEGNLWLGTSSGISLFIVKKEEFKNFSNSDGILNADINPAASVSVDDDILLMGSTAGLNYFYPGSIKLSSTLPSLTITDFQIFNLSVMPDENSVLEKSILFTDEIELAHSQNVFSFEFSALDFYSPHSIQYAYIMEGFDKEWIYSGSRRFVTYTNLNPGEYIFKVRSTNSDGVWGNNIRQVKITIIPPWWQTNWALALYFLFIVIGIWGIVKFQSYRTKLQNELRMQEIESHHLREIESLKSRFFANLSHEFRTPLTLIKGPLEQILSGKIKENLHHYYKVILNNTEKLQELIEQLLELSRLDFKSIPVINSRQELISLLKTLTYSFIPLAEQKFITLKFEANVDNLEVLIDRDKLEKIINNLLSNAFKFTPAGGRIQVIINCDNADNNSNVMIEIIDNGIGIPDQFSSKIFDRFFQMNTELHKSVSGSGIGLALVKELVNLLNWEISVKSKENEGTTFRLTMTLERAASVQTNTESETDEYSDIPINSEHDEHISELDNEEDTEKIKPSILIVEDSNDTRNYLIDLFKHDYNILSASTADEGIELAFNNMPELILSDIMMPGTSGLEFCKKIKTDWQTSHIPVILLTAKASEENKIEGLETGADDYVVKPFRYEELAVRIKNLVEQRKHLHDKFSNDLNIQPHQLVKNSVDEEFIKKVTQSVQKNLTDNKFNSELLARELFVSRRQLHRKLIAITGHGPGEFIRIMRLKKAAQLLLENNLSVTQISYEIGFESPAQFSRAFKKHFHSLPSEFYKNNSGDSLNHQG